MISLGQFNIFYLAIGVFLHSFCVIVAGARCIPDHFSGCFPFHMYCCSNNPQAYLEWFCLQDVRTANPPVRAAQSGTLCSQCSLTSIYVCLHSSIHPRVGLFFYSVAGFADCRSDMNPQQAFCIKGIPAPHWFQVQGVLIRLRSHGWHHLSGLAFILT